jgi:cytoskeleton-associated protein 5
VKIVKQIIGLIDTQPDVLREILDVFFKWCYIKLTESSNTTLYVSVFDCFQTLFDWLEKDGYQLMEHEAFILIPLLCEKAGVNNAILKTKVKALLKQSLNFYDQKKTIALILKFGTNSKNLKSVAESLEEIASFVQKNGVECLTEKDLKHFAKLADNGDKGVREGAL